MMRLTHCLRRTSTPVYFGDFLITFGAFHEKYTQSKCLVDQHFGNSLIFCHIVFFRIETLATREYEGVVAPTDNQIIILISPLISDRYFMGGGYFSEPRATNLFCFLPKMYPSKFRLRCYYMHRMIRIGLL